MELNHKDNIYIVPTMISSDLLESLKIKYKQQSVDDLKNGVQWPYRRDTFVCDYCKNGELPHFVNEQPGETYYYSLLGVYIFVMANYTDEKMNDYVYHEGEAAKGGNNVYSLVYKTLKILASSMIGRNQAKK